MQFFAPGRLRRVSDLVALAVTVLALVGCAGPHDQDEPMDEAATEITWERDAPPSLVVYLVDTLRRDHLGVYGGPEGLTPNLDAFASEAWVFEDAMVNASWTRPAVGSLFTGLLPERHGAVSRRDALADENLTLAERLGEIGFRSRGILLNPNVAGRLGFRQGFERYRLLSATADADRWLALAESWLRDLREGPRFFFYLHTVEPHSPYNPPDRFRRQWAPEVDVGVEDDPAVGTQAWFRRSSMQEKVEKIAELRALYAAEVAWADDNFGRFVALLERLELLDRSIVVVLSDHGEEFHEHGGFRHGRTLHTESVDVPLLVRLPGGELRRWPEPVSPVDLFATLLELLGAPSGSSEPAIDGRSVVWPPVRAGEHPRSVLATLDVDGHRRSSWTDARVRALLDRAEAPPLVRVFDRDSDSGETSPLEGLSESREAALLKRLDEAVAGPRVGSAAAPELDEETRRELEELGYVE